MFLGIIIIALVSVEIYTKLVTSGVMKIKMPDSVPSNVSNSFNVLFPSMAAILANTDMVAQGIHDISKLNIINMSFWDTYMSLGGSGCTLGLVIAILILSKREDYRAIAKLEVAPAIFEINEPMIFGLPIVLNPLLVVPFIITPLVTGSFAYFMTKIGFAGVCVYAMPWTTPPILSAWLSTGGSVGAIITQLICILLAIVIYAPFVLLANRAQEVEQ